MNEKSEISKAESPAIHNAQFGYSFNIPANWTANESADGYSVKNASNQEIILVYVETIQPELADIMQPDCETLNDFTFSEGLEGKACQKENSFTYYLERENKRYSFHFPDWKNLSVTDKANGQLVIKSIKFSEQLPS